MSRAGQPNEKPAQGTPKAWDNSDGGMLMSIAEEWQRLKTELQQDADRLSPRATGTLLQNRIEADLTAILQISEPNNDQELTTRRKIFDLFRTEWRTAVMNTRHFRDNQSGA
jgi:hypothetical protein